MPLHFLREVLQRPPGEDSKRKVRRARLASEAAAGPLEPFGGLPGLVASPASRWDALAKAFLG